MLRYSLWNFHFWATGSELGQAGLCEVIITQPEDAQFRSFRQCDKACIG